MRPKLNLQDLLRTTDGRACALCSKTFHPIRQWQIFCSDVCRKTWHRNELLAAREALAEKRAAKPQREGGHADSA